MLYYAKSPHSWALPSEWQKICEKFPAIIRNKVKTTHASYNNATATTTNSATTNSPTTFNTTPYFPSTTTTKACYSSLSLRVASHNAAHSSTTTTTTSAITTTTTTNKISNSSDITKELDTTNSAVTAEEKTAAKIVTNNNIDVHNNLSQTFKNVNNTNSSSQDVHEPNMNEKYLVHSSSAITAATTPPFKSNPYGSHLSLNIKRKGFFNRLTYSIDEDGYESLMNASPTAEVPPPNPLTTSIPVQQVNATAVIGGSGRLNNVHINRQLISIRTGPMTSSPIAQSPVNANEGCCTPNESNTRQKLLHKQMKIISDIMVESSKTGNSNNNNNHMKSLESLKSTISESSKISNDDNDNVDDEDDDNDVEIVEVSNVAGTNAPPLASNPTTMTRPKLSYEFRSYSTCD